MDIGMYETEKVFDIQMCCTVMVYSMIWHKGLSCKLKFHPTRCLSITALYLLIEWNMMNGKLIGFMKTMALLADHTCRNTLKVLKFGLKKCWRQQYYCMWNAENIKIHKLQHHSFLTSVIYMKRMSDLKVITIWRLVIRYNKRWAYPPLVSKKCGKKRMYVGSLK